MREAYSTDQIRPRVFVAPLPGMSLDRERALIRRCRLLARTTLEAGMPLAVAWSMIVQQVERMSQSLRSDYERESFAAVMHRLHVELFQDRSFVS